MIIPDSKIKFICGLSNGESLVEGKGILSNETGGDSPWWKLQKYIKDNNLTINSFGLWVGDRHYNLPSNSPKFKGEVPISYNCYRKIATDALSGEEVKEHYICAEAKYPTYKVQLWIDELDDNKCWLNILPIS